jgi:uncharacterized protein
MTKSVIVADAGPLIALAKCEQLPLLSTLFGTVHVPHTVLMEATGGKPKPESESIRAFVMGYCIVQPDRDDALVQHLLRRLDAGESQAISWAHHLGCAVLIDEKQGRLMAQAQGLPIFGVLGMLLLAKQAGHVQALAPLVNSLREHRYNLSDALVAAVLQKAGEQ